MTTRKQQLWEPHGPAAIPLLRSGVSLAGTVWAGCAAALALGDHRASFLLGVRIGAVAALTPFFALSLWGLRTEQRNVTAPEAFWLAREARTRPRMLAAALVACAAALVAGMGGLATHDHVLLGCAVVPLGLGVGVVTKMWGKVR